MTDVRGDWRKYLVYFQWSRLEEEGVLSAATINADLLAFIKS
jgi:hypothetical protein